MIIKYEYKYECENKEWGKGKGSTEISERKWNLFNQKCNEYKCNMTEVICHIIENLTEESAEELISTMSIW